MSVSKLRQWSAAVVFGSVAVASGLVMQAESASQAGSAEPTCVTTTTTKPPPTPTSQPTSTTTTVPCVQPYTPPTTTTTTLPPAVHGIGNDWSYWWLPATREDRITIDGSSRSSSDSHRSAIPWYIFMLTQKDQVTPPGSPFTTDGLDNIDTTISGYYEITFSVSSRYLSGKGGDPLWAFQPTNSDLAQDTYAFPQCVAPSVQITTGHSVVSQADMTCVAKLDARRPYDMVLRTDLTVIPTLAYSSTLPAATLMMQLLTPTT
jgi:hypothetical protein